MSTSFSFATAPRSPGPNSSAWSCSFPWSLSSCPTRSLLCERAFTSVESDDTVPSITRKTLMRPANGSATVLKTKAALEAPSMWTSKSFFAGDGTPSTSRSSVAVVPRFLVATPHATGKISPRVTASFSACATSSAESSWPSRYRSIRLSSVSTTESRSCSRYFATWSAISAGISPGADSLAPSGLVYAVMCSRSTIPPTSCSAPIGRWTATQRVENVFRSCSRTR